MLFQPNNFHVDPFEFSWQRPEILSKAEIFLVNADIFYNFVGRMNEKRIEKFHLPGPEWTPHIDMHFR